MHASRRAARACGTTAQREGWRRIVDFVHAHSPAKIALQLGHAGRKGSTQLGWQEMDQAAAGGQLAADLGLRSCRILPA